MRVIRPPDELSDIVGPVIFLAGPIQGAYPWHEVAIEHLRVETGDHPSLVVASPARLGVRGKFTDADYYQQVDWEDQYLDRAHKCGVILFWCGRENEAVPGRSYAQTTRVEFGERITEQRLLGGNMVVGVEDGFSGARYMRYKASKKGRGVSTAYHLQETCQIAAQLVTPLLTAHAK